VACKSNTNQEQQEQWGGNTHQHMNLDMTKQLRLLKVTPMLRLQKVSKLKDDKTSIRPMNQDSKASTQNDEQLEQQWRKSIR